MSYWLVCACVWMSYGSVVACCGCWNKKEVVHSLLELPTMKLQYKTISGSFLRTCNDIVICHPRGFMQCTSLFLFLSISYCFLAPPCFLSQHPLQHSSQQSTPKDTALIKTYSNTASAEEGPKLWQHKWAHSPSHANSKLHLQQLK